MHLSLYCIGKLGPKHWQEASRAYLKYLRPYHSVQIIELADEKDPKQNSPTAIAKLLAKEGDRLLKALPKDLPFIALDVHGEEMSTESMAQRFAEFDSRGQSRLAFVIGGSYGLDPKLRSKAQSLWSLSKLTFPHQLARILLLEQILRCAKITKGHRYHK